MLLAKGLAWQARDDAGHTKPLTPLIFPLFPLVPLAFARGNIPIGLHHLAAAHHKQQQPGGQGAKQDQHKHGHRQGALAQGEHQHHVKPANPDNVHGKKAPCGAWVVNTSDCSRVGRRHAPLTKPAWRGCAALPCLRLCAWSGARRCVA